MTDESAEPVRVHPSVDHPPATAVAGSRARRPSGAALRTPRLADNNLKGAALRVTELDVLGRLALAVVPEQTLDPGASLAGPQALRERHLISRIEERGTNSRGAATP